MENEQAISKEVTVNNVRLLVEGYFNSETNCIDEMKVLVGDVDICEILALSLLTRLESLAISDEDTMYV